jgi:hypothetical protein
VPQKGKVEKYGLEYRTRRSGERIPYWRASRKAVSAGYPTPVAPLDRRMTEAALIEDCKRRTLEMKNWLTGIRTGPAVYRIGIRPGFDGTVRSLIRQYETDPTSRYCIPFEDGGIKFNTRDQYTDLNIQLDRAVGERLIANITRDVLWNWYLGFAQPAVEGGPRRLTKAKECMAQFNRIINYGVSAEIDGCERVARIMNGVGNKKAKTLIFKGGGRRKGEPLTLEYLAIFCAKAHERGYHSLALATTIQFETMLRQGDVIGQWWPVEQSVEGSLVMDGHRWRGLTWGEHVKADLTMDKPTFKSRETKSALYDFKDSSLILAELERIPIERRVGPVVISERSGRPWVRKTFHHAWRRIANEAGLPKWVQNRDARSGAISEADLAAVAPEDRMAQATHATVEMNDSYKRETMAKTKKVTAARMALRAEKKRC